MIPRSCSHLGCPFLPARRATGIGPHLGTNGDRPDRLPRRDQEGRRVLAHSLSVSSSAISWASSVQRDESKSAASEDAEVTVLAEGRREYPVNRPRAFSDPRPAAAGRRESLAGAAREDCRSLVQSSRYPLPGLSSASATARRSRNAESVSQYAIDGWAIAADRNTTIGWLAAGKWIAVSHRGDGEDGDKGEISGHCRGQSVTSTNSPVAPGQPRIFGLRRLHELHRLIRSSSGLLGIAKERLCG
jgi:hypothetical protein